MPPTLGTPAYLPTQATEITSATAGMSVRYFNSSGCNLHTGYTQHAAAPGMSGLSL